ncbi:MULTISPECIES: hypothetical protein [Paenibacillus]|jgi:hypothetical protein|uniref:Uncharacterized protein n=1 Tax=Paenibacillus polymyxa TaxID=1406 RepID=A0A378XW68_PAEPO|nr:MULTISPECIES: hypothetical protein [Paenibacillus]AHM64786.1 hypothetical protein PPSQR21_011260 [Paenibacillus polymyxa SQR-21]AUS25366.1 hypothetical protein C1A50_1181 [Paenibacillus polymyxa]KAF6618429.1 hypothetical protein HFE00_10135 [Paenibacillus sp. EKM101P]KAF6624775.1 hypothetical protein HFE03_04300 [Paenibacillus sp. EKM102P]KAF6635445.1 hypothetical protein HFE01_00735 [Paenibacillus sp. EKM10P]
MNEREQNYTILKITVNGKPLSKELIVDSTTFAPISDICTNTKVSLTETTIS